MMKKLLLLTLCLLLIVAVGSAQYRFLKVFPDSATLSKTHGAGINNGIAVDPAGRVWIQTYSGSIDSVAPGVKTGSIYVYNPNGTQASFSPIQILSGKDEKGNNVTDTLNGTGYGLTTDPATGNIFSVKWSSRIWKIDYKTGKGIVRVASPIPGYTSSLSTPAVDKFGEVFVVPVLPGAPIAVLNPDFTAAGTIGPPTGGYARCIAVSADGNDVIHTQFSPAKNYLYHSDNGSLGPYVLKDSIMSELVVECVAWHPKTGYLWAGSGNTVSGMPTGGKAGYAWYAYDMKTKKYMDSIKWQGWKTGDDPRPRGIAFSPTGDTVYVGGFGVAPNIQMWVKGTGTSVEQEQGVVPTDFTLSQNYPNPFNPSTQIRFSITQTGSTTLKVYDVMGREVSTLVNEILAPGSYSVKFDGARLSSGTYLYVLTSGGHRLMNKMVLIK